MKLEALKPIIDICRTAGIPEHTSAPWEHVLDYQTDPYLYIFTSGEYVVKFRTRFWWEGEVWCIHEYGVIGEGIFFEKHGKPVLLVSEKAGTYYKVDLETIKKIDEKHKDFEKDLMRTCLQSVNEYLTDANLERTLNHTLVANCEKNMRTSIIDGLSLIKDTFEMNEVLWVERHEALKEVYILRYRTSRGNTPINEPINMSGIIDHAPISVENFAGFDGMSHIYPISSLGVLYGFLIMRNTDPVLKNYTSRIIENLNPIFVQMIESKWKTCHA